MSAVQTPAATAAPATVGKARVFLAVLRRDLYVTGRELPVFLAQVVLQPLFLLLVFGRVLTDLGFTRPGYTEVLFPGIVAMTAVLTALQSTAFPLVIDFSFTPGARSWSWPPAWWCSRRSAPASSSAAPSTSPAPDHGIAWARGTPRR